MRAFVAFQFEKPYSDGPTQVYASGQGSKVHVACVKVGSNAPAFFDLQTKQGCDQFQALQWAELDAVVVDPLIDGAVLAREIVARPSSLLDLNSFARAHNFSAYHAPGGALSVEQILAPMGYQREFDTPVGSSKDCVYDRLGKKVEAMGWLLDKMRSAVPAAEDLCISQNNMAFCYPALEFDRERTQAYVNAYQSERDEILKEILELMPKSDALTNEKLEKAIASDEEFSKLLKKQGCPVPESVSFSKDSHWVHGMLEAGSKPARKLLKAKIFITSKQGDIARARHCLALPSTTPSFPIGLKYFGAITSRFQSDPRDKINFQGVESSSEVKASVKAPDGHVILSCDYSKIELILGLYLAGDHTKLQEIGAGADPYRGAYAEIHGVGTDQVSDQERSTGKEVVLSGIFGASGEAIKNRLYQNQRTIITLEEANRLVSGFRKKNSKIVACWNECEKALDLLSKNPDIEGFSLFGGIIPWDKDSKSFILPSGLRYQLPNLHKGVDGKFYYGESNKKGQLYPSKLYQNIVQGCGRAMLTNMITTGVKFDLGLALSVHDSCFWVASEAHALACVRELESALFVAPAWAPHLPIKVDTEVGVNMRDLKPLAKWLVEHGVNPTAPAVPVTQPKASSTEPRTTPAVTAPAALESSKTDSAVAHSDSPQLKIRATAARPRFPG